MSFEFEISKSDQRRADLIGRIGRDLQNAFVSRKVADGTTQQEIAEALGVDRSRVNRCLSGHANLTLGTLADLVGALNAEILVKIVPADQANNWKLVFSRPNATASHGSVATTQSADVTQRSQASVGKW